MKNKFKLTKKLDHIAFIMDGNGRWANINNLPRHIGHYEGIKRIYEMIKACKSLNIKIMSIYALSKENMSRPKEEVNHLFNYLDDFFVKHINKFIEENIKVSVMGDISVFPSKTISTINKAIELTKNNNSFIFNICLNYGSTHELAKACKEIAVLYKDNEITLNDITPSLINDHLYSNQLPPIDLMIRTSGECRLSNFMLFQLSYSELIFTKTYWPDFKKENLIECLKEYETRHRRFGNI